MSPDVFMMYVCFDPEPPNGSEWAIAILTTNVPSVQGVLFNLGYAKVMLLSSDWSLLCISTYQPITYSNNPLYKEEDIASFLAVHIAKAKCSQWWMIISGQKIGAQKTKI
jgi:hypothetical protein